MLILVLKMAGEGTRFGGALPKQFVDVDGTPLFLRVLHQYEKNGIPDRIICIVNESFLHVAEETTRAEFFSATPIHFVKGGASSFESVINGIRFLEDYASGDDIILFHDVTNPIVVPPNIIWKIIDAAKATGAATLCTEQVHVLFSRDGDVILGEVDKKQYVSGYSPEAYRFGLIRDIFLKINQDEAKSLVSPASALIKRSIPIVLVPSRIPNIKITYPEDLAFYKAYLVMAHD